MPWICASSPPGARVTRCGCSASASRTSKASAATSRRRAGPGAGYSPAVHDRRVLQVRGRGGTAGPFPGSVRPPSPAGLRVPCHRPGPQRGRRPAGRGRARHRGRARPDLAARTERAAGLRGRRRRHRALGTERGHRTLAITRKGGEKAVIPLAPRTARAIDLAVGERCEGPIFTTPAGQRLDRQGAGRIVRRVARRAGLAKRNRPAHPPPRLHHLYQFRRRRPAARRPASGLARRPENHHPLRPGPGLAGPARHLHRRRLHRRSRPVTAPRGRTAWQRHSRQAARRRQLARARSRSATYWRGQIARRGLDLYSARSLAAGGAQSTYRMFWNPRAAHSGRGRRASARAAGCGW
jgi:hypothetical protein